jgi:ABC-2 type transport system permease protein
MNLKHLKAIASKEFLHILRDPGTLLLVTLGPLFLMVVFTYTMTSEVENAEVAVIDRADNEASETLVERLDANKVVKISEHLASEAEADELFEKNEIVAVVIIPAGYGEIQSEEQIPRLLSGQESMPQVEAIIDGTEPVSAEKVLDEVYRISNDYTSERAIEILRQHGIEAGADVFDTPIKIEEETRFNPELRSVVDIYPGLVGMMLTLPAIALAMSLARENEAGTLEQLIATPIDKRAMLTGKMTPYLLFGMIDVYVLLVLGMVAYDVPFRGSLIDYSIIALLFMMANLGIGLLIAVLIRSQQLAIIVALLVFFIPPFFLSGLFFPAEAMPWIVQLQMVEFPTTHFVTASKAIFLKGSGIGDLIFPTAVLAFLAIGVTEIATYIFRKKVTITFSFKKLWEGIRNLGNRVELAERKEATK